MSAITIDNDLIHYEVLGRGRPVILIHGWLGSWRYWISAMQQLSLSNKYRIYALDLCGYGDSQKNSAHYGLSSQVTLLQQFMEKLGIEKAAIVGHALGAAIAIEFARKNPQAAPKVMLISPPLFAGPTAALPPVATGAPLTTAPTTPAVPTPPPAITPSPTTSGAPASAPSQPTPPTPPAGQPAVSNQPTGVAVAPSGASSAAPSQVATQQKPATSLQTTAPTPPTVQPAVSNQPAVPEAISSSTTGVSVAAAATPVKTSTSPVPDVLSTGDANASDTLRRNPFLDNPERFAQLQAAAAAAGVSIGAIAAPKSAEPPPTPVASQPNPLADILTGIKPKALLERQLMRGDDTLEKLRDEVDKTDETAFAESAKSFSGVNLAQALSQLPMAVLLLHGQADPLLPSPDEDFLARIVAQKATGALLPLIVPDYRHFPMLEHPSQFNRLLVDFLDADLTNAQANVSLKETWRRQLR